MTIKPKHPEEKHSEEKHPSEEKHDRPERELKQRVSMKSSGDEVIVTHGTESYHVPRQGDIDLPAHVAEHVIRQGGAEALNPPPPPAEGMIKVKHTTDPKTIISQGDQVLFPDSKGEIEIPLSTLADAEPHGFTPV